MKFDDPLEEEQAKRQDGAQLDDDRVHLPVGDRPSGIFISASAMRRCAVELTGKNSVKPSTMPKRMD